MNWLRVQIPASVVAVVFLLFAGSMAQAATTQAPQRIVSLAPSVTEMLFALGFGARVVGVTTYCDYPAEAKKLPKIGSFVNPSLEAVAAQRPDLVIGVNDANQSLKAREIAQLGLNISLVSLNNVNEIFIAIKSVARWLGNAESGEQLVRKIAQQFEAVKKRVESAPRRRTLLVVGLRPLVAAGGGSYIDELISAAGGDNIAGNAAQPWLNLPDEYVVARAPQVIIEAGMGSERGQGTRNWYDLKSIPAVKERRVYAYPSDKILRPGPRIGEGLEEIARLIHPECFAESKDRPGKGPRCERSQP